ncbi:putative Kinase-like protein [Seiridium cardinale]
MPRLELESWRKGLWLGIWHAGKWKTPKRLDRRAKKATSSSDWEVHDFLPESSVRLKLNRYRFVPESTVGNNDANDYNDEVELVLPEGCYVDASRSSIRLSIHHALLREVEVRAAISTRYIKFHNTEQRVEITEFRKNTFDFRVTVAISLQVGDYMHVVCIGPFKSPPQDSLLERITKTLYLIDSDVDILVLEPSRLDKYLVGEDGEIYSRGKPLGKGGFGIVERGTRKRDTFAVAIKSIRTNRHTAYLVERERTNLRSCHSNYIVGYLDFCRISRYSCSLIMELGRCNIEQYSTEAAGKLPLDQIYTIGYQMCRALEYRHTKLNVTHRDVKPANIMVFKKNPLLVKLGDFGMSSADTLVTKFSSSYYTAPEIRSNEHAQYTDKCDIWSLGVTIVVLLWGPPIYEVGHVITALMHLWEHEGHKRGKRCSMTQKRGRPLMNETANISSLAANVLGALLDTCNLEVTDRTTLIGILNAAHVPSRENELAYRVFQSIIQYHETRAALTPLEKTVVTKLLNSIKNLAATPSEASSALRDPATDPAEFEALIAIGIVGNTVEDGAAAVEWETSQTSSRDPPDLNHQDKSPRSHATIREKHVAPQVNANESGLKHQDKPSHSVSSTSEKRDVIDTQVLPHLRGRLHKAQAPMKAIDKSDPFPTSKQVFCDTFVLPHARSHLVGATAPVNTKVNSDLSLTSKQVVLSTDVPPHARGRSGETRAHAYDTVNSDFSPASKQVSHVEERMRTLEITERESSQGTKKQRSGLYTSFVTGGIEHRGIQKSTTPYTTVETTKSARWESKALTSPDTLTKQYSYATRLMTNMGWKPGSGLGVERNGIKEPIYTTESSYDEDVNTDRSGLGYLRSHRTDTREAEDEEQEWVNPLLDDPYGHKSDPRHPDSHMNGW